MLSPAPKRGPRGCPHLAASPHARMNMPKLERHAARTGQGLASWGANHGWPAENPTRMHACMHVNTHTNTHEYGSTIRRAATGRPGTPPGSDAHTGYTTAHSALRNVLGAQAHACFAAPPARFHQGTTRPVWARAPHRPQTHPWTLAGEPIPPPRTHRWQTCRR